jgi:hypothetical protein
MKFIEINNDVCVNMDKVEWIASDQQGFGCVVCVGNKEYPCDIPYKTLISILQSNDEAKTMQKLDNYLSNATITTL